MCSVEHPAGSRPGYRHKTTRRPSITRLASQRVGYRLILVTLAGLLLGACESTALINALTPRDNFTLEQDLAYGPAQRHRLDIYRPKNRPSDPRVVVFIHGGSWDDGDKDDYLFVGQAFTEMGFITIIPNYRLHPEAQFPDFVDDIARAIATLPELLNLAPIDRLQIVLVGHSAGAHSAAMLATEPKFLQRNGATAELHALIGIAGPYDLPLQHAAVRGKFDRLEHPNAANPVHLASALAPPTLLLYGSDDRTVATHHIERFDERLRQVGVPTRMRIIPKADHKTIVGALASRLRFLNPVFEEIRVYLYSSSLNKTSAINRSFPGFDRMAQVSSDTGNRQ